MADPDVDLILTFGGDRSKLPARARRLTPESTPAATSAPTSAAQPATREAEYGSQQQEPPATRRRATQEPQGAAASTPAPEASAAKPEAPAPATEPSQLSSPAATEATNDANELDGQFAASDPGPGPQAATPRRYTPVATTPPARPHRSAEEISRQIEAEDEMDWGRGTPTPPTSMDLITPTLTALEAWLPTVAPGDRRAVIDKLMHLVEVAIRTDAQ